MRARLRSRQLALVVALFVIATLRKAEARADDAIAIRVDYTAPLKCPNFEAFRDQIKLRAPTLHIDDENPERTFRVTIAPNGAGFDGQIVVFAGTEQRGVRRVTGDHCDEVASALALVLALDVNGAAEEKKIVAAPLVAKKTERASRWRLGVGADVSVAGGFAPDVVFGVPAHVELLRFGPAILSPSFRLAFERTFTRTFGFGAASAAFTATTGQLDVCPVHFSLRSFSLTPCARVDGGILAADGSQIIAAQNSTQPWFALGLAGRAAWWIFDPVAIEIEGALRAPLARQDYEFLPDSTVYRTPLVSGTASAGVSLYFF